MGSFEGRTWKIYLDEETREQVHQIKEHLQEHYDGPSDFVQEKLHEEEALDIDERINRARQEKKELDEKLSRLQQMKTDREEASMLRDKRELLKSKQEKLTEMRKEDNSVSKSREEVRQEVVEEIREKCRSSPKVDDVDEHLESERVQSRIEHRVDSRMPDKDVDQLVQDVRRLQEEVAELNGGRESYFLDLETGEGVEA